MSEEIDKVGDPRLPEDDAQPGEHPSGRITALRYSKAGARAIALAGLAFTAWQAAGQPTYTATSFR